MLILLLLFITFDPILFYKVGEINTGLKRGKSKEDQPYDNESRRQVKRFLPNGKLYPFVEHLVDTWFLPLLEMYAAAEIPPAAGKLMDAYRPLEHEEVL